MIIMLTYRGDETQFPYPSEKPGIGHIQTHQTLSQPEPKRAPTRHLRAAARLFQWIRLPIRLSQSTRTLVGVSTRITILTITGLLLLWATLHVNPRPLDSPVRRMMPVYPEPNPDPRSRRRRSARRGSKSRQRHTPLDGLARRRNLR